MAVLSPVLSSNSSSLASTAVAASSAATASSFISSARRSETTPKTLRGLNKPKCRVCGNVARSRCPYESCKSCCSKNQNPCHIHVLKANATFQDKTLTSNSPLFDQQSTEPSPSGYLSGVHLEWLPFVNFQAINNVHISLRSRKPLSRKDATAINEWRFLKLREYQERSIEAENEAFDRYIQNVGLLEDIFSMESVFEGSVEDNSSSLNPNALLPEDKSKVMVSELKFKLQSNMARSDNSRKRMQKSVDEGLKKFRTCNNDDLEQLTDQNSLSEGIRRARTEKASALSELLHKLNKARNKEDFKSCLIMKSQLFSSQRRPGSTESEEIDITRDQASKDEFDPKTESTFSMPKFFCVAEIDQDTLNKIEGSTKKITDFKDGEDHRASTFHQYVFNTSDDGVLIFNVSRRSMPFQCPLSKQGEDKDDSQLQHRPGRFLDQFHVPFDNRGISNGCKRREEIATPINYFQTNHSPPNQFIELPLLRNQPSDGVSAGLRSKLDDQKQLEFSDEKFSSLIEYQRVEIEQLLYFKNEELQRTLDFRRKKHCRGLLRAAKEMVARKLTETAAEVEQAAQRNAEYEARAAQLSVETQLWREKAKCQESIAAVLRAKLRKAMTESAQGRRGGALECAERVAEDAESGHAKTGRIIIHDPKCRGCRSRVATVVFLPCRHLCVCRNCEKVVKICPICLGSSDSRVEVNIN